MQQELYQAAAQTFEALAFLSPVPPEEADARQGQLDQAVCVAFRGPFCGRLELRTCAGLMPALAENMMGEDAPPTLDQQRDALGEVANVICGNVLPAIAGSREVFHLDAPRFVTACEPETPPAASVRMCLDAGCAEVLLFTDLSVAA
ncbi:MAG TPA: chemotaxis protein CheX [Armatimonadota bacterium]|jgi:CheY-specific phosphatase CheX